MSIYLSLAVEKVVRETEDTLCIHFKQPAPPLSYRPGQFLTLLVPVAGTVHRRSYSLCSSPLTDAHLAVTVKRIAGGTVSNHLNDHLRPGAVLEALEPAGTFTLTPDASRQRQVVLLGAGSGITPLLSMTKAVLHAEPRSRVSLLYGSRTETSIIFKNDLDALARQHPGRLAVTHVLSQPSAAWTGHRGRLNQSAILKHLETLPQWPDTEYYLCGPAGMMDEARQALHLLQVPGQRIHSESFLPAAKEEPHGTVTEQAAPGDDGAEVKDRTITLLYEGTEYKLHVPARQTILEAALDNGIDLPYSCQSGMCTACMGKCLSGKVMLDEEDGLSETEVKMGFVLTCVAHPLTADVVVQVE